MPIVTECASKRSSERVRELACVWINHARDAAELIGAVELRVGRTTGRLAHAASHSARTTSGW